MTDAKRVAAGRICVGFDGYEPTRGVLELIDAGICGVVLFRRNVRSAEQVSELCAALKRHAGRPLLMCVDQEGGRVRRLEEGFSDVPSMRDLGRCDDAELAEAVGGILGRELRAVNFDLDFAPVVDVDTNPANPVIGARSLGSSPQKVGRMGAAIVRGIQSARVGACAKHFPGHGDTTQDSHTDLPRLEHDMKRMGAVELVPFEEAIGAGVASVMSAHVMFPAIDAEYPATMSGKIIGGLLRERMRFDGVVFSDDMEMAAIAEHFGVANAAVRAAQAGVDLMLICHREDRQWGAIEAMAAAMERGEITQEQVGESKQRVERLVSEYAKPPVGREALGVLDCAEHRAVVGRVNARRISEEMDPTERIA